MQYVFPQWTPLTTPLDLLPVVLPYPHASTAPPPLLLLSTLSPHPPPTPPYPHRPSSSVAFIHTISTSTLSPPPHLLCCFYLHYLHLHLIPNTPTIICTCLFFLLLTFRPLLYDFISSKTHILTSLSLSSVVRPSSSSAILQPYAILHLSWY